jgi:hypothetical protein
MIVKCRSGYGKPVQQFIGIWDLEIGTEIRPDVQPA